MNTFILTIVLLTPAHVRQQVIYTELSEKACETLKKSEVEAIKANSDGWRLISAKCERA